MKYIIDFYKGLDAVNLIIFWGTLIVVLLLLTFSIIIANKNKKLKRIIESNGINIDDYDFDEELAIKKDLDKENIKIKIEKEPIQQNVEQTNIEEKNIEQRNIEQRNIEQRNIEQRNIEQRNLINNNDYIPLNETKEEVPKQKFSPEELVMEYNKNEKPKPEISNITRNNIEIKEKADNYQINKELSNQISKSQVNIIKENNYQNINVKNNSLNQTSPIGIVKPREKTLDDINKAKELQSSLNYQEKQSKEVTTSNINTLNRQAELAREIKKQEIYDTKPKGNYLEEISKSLSKITNDEGINRTEYELKQEEDAIISYKELMEKKDSIETIEEEEAIISMEELMKKKQNEDKLYNLTNDAEDDKFINELKNFRSDLK